MLKRTAENAVWLNRYRVRIEIIARAIEQHHASLLDMPKRSRQGQNLASDIDSWMPCFLIAGIDNPEDFEDSPHAGIELLIAAPEHGNSLLTLIQQMHTNLRCCRDFLPQDLYESMSHLCMQSAQSLSLGTSLPSIIAILRDIELQMMTISGQIEMRMAHNHVYLFLKAGELIERADMSTRIIEMTEDSLFREAPVLSIVSNDTGDTESDGKTGDAAGKTKQSHKPTQARSALSRSSVRALALNIMAVDNTNTGASAGPKVIPAPGVVDMNLVASVLQDPHHPQSLAHCLTKLDQILSRLDPKQPSAARCRELVKRVIYIDTTRSAWLTGEFHDLMEAYQDEIAELYDDLFDRYMRGGPSQDFSVNSVAPPPLKRSAQ